MPVRSVSGVLRSTGQLMLGRPLRTTETERGRINPLEGLPALSLDALTSVAYGPQAMVIVLAVAGAGALGLVLPITLAIIGLLVLLIASYRQVIEAFPNGGGAYAVSRAHLGAGFSLLAAAALVVDYSLTVAVSIAAGVGALTSAFPVLQSGTVPLCLGILAVITVLNLRGQGEAARTFLLPTLVFIVGLIAIVFVGLVHPLALHVGQPGRSLLPARGLEAINLLLVLKAFSAGCSALTGIEAVANGVPLFKPPQVVQAKRTELLIGVILGVMLLGLAVLVRRFRVGPRAGNTVLSQVMSIAVGRHWAYFVVSVTITLVLALAANTSFGGLPILASLLARDSYLPHLFTLRGDRQVYSNGILVLSVFAAALLIAVGGNTDALIPLFAIGVFSAFTLSQAGLVVHWLQARPAHWRLRIALNGLGALVTGVATLVFVFTKFTEGAWVVVMVVPGFIFVFRRIHRYYEQAASVLGIGQIPPRPHGKRTEVIVPVSSVSKATARALDEARSLGRDVVAVTVALDHDEAGQAALEGLERDWARWSPGVALRVLHTEYASIVEPIVAFIDAERERSDHQIVVLIPVVVPEKLRHRILHNHLDVLLSSALKTRTDVVVARVPMSIALPFPSAEAAPYDPGVDVGS